MAALSKLLGLCWPPQEAALPYVLRDRAPAGPPSAATSPTRTPTPSRSVEAGEAGRCNSPKEHDVAEILRDFAARSPANRPELCALEPKAFAEQVINGKVAVDDGDWVQPIYRREGGGWHLSRLEVLYRVRDASKVPFPAFVNFVHSATDQAKTPDPEMRSAFEGYAISSIRRVDERLSNLDAEHRQALEQAAILTCVNVTAKQLEAVLEVPVANPQLLALEETEYDNAPGRLQELRLRAWAKFGAFFLDDIKPTLADVMSSLVVLKEGDASPGEYTPPLTPGGQPYKPLVDRYNHDLPFARRFIADFRHAREQTPSAQAELKLAEDFCLYLIGVGYAPFARAAMADWREANPQLSAAVRRAGVELIRDALDAGMGICLEVSFEDDDVQWLHNELPQLDGRLSKQGGRSGPAALPHSMVEKVMLPTRDEWSPQAGSFSL